MRYAVAALALTFAIPAAAAELPTRKAGLWEMKMTREGTSTAMPTMQQCTDTSTDKDMATMFGGMQQQCSKRDIQDAGGKIVIDSACAFGPMKTTSHAEITGDFNSAYTVKVTSQVEGGPAPGPQTMMIEAKWLGPCKPDQKAGDILMPGGMKINIKDMQNFHGMAPRQ